MRGGGAEGFGRFASRWLSGLGSVHAAKVVSVQGVVCVLSSFLRLEIKTHKRLK